MSISPPSRLSDQQAIVALLEQALLAIHLHIEAHGDGDVPRGEARWAGNDGTVLRVANANNHQLTWGVLGVAIQGVKSVLGEGALGRASFVIFDGRNMVGRGWIEV